jgi:hypothetical protein
MLTLLLGINATRIHFSLRGGAFPRSVTFLAEGSRGLDRAHFFLNLPKLVRLRVLRAQNEETCISLCAKMRRLLNC